MASQLCHLQQPDLNLFILQQSAWFLFVNLSVVFFNPLLKLMNLSVNCLTCLFYTCFNVSQFVASTCCYLCALCQSCWITTATFPSHIPNICYANAAIRSFSSKLKTTSSLEFSLSSHQKRAPTSATRPPYTPSPARVGSSLLTTLSISWQKTSDRAASVPSCCLPCGIGVSSVNSLNSSYVARTNLFSFKATKSLVLKSLAPLKTSICVTLLLVEQLLMVQFLIQQIPHSLVLHLCSILFLILSKW